MRTNVFKLYEVKLAIQGFRNKNLSITMILLTLGITFGVLATVSQLTYTLLFKKLPYNDSERLVSINNVLANDVIATDGNGASIIASDIINREIQQGKLTHFETASPVLLKKETISLGQLKRLDVYARYVSSHYFDILTGESFYLGGVPTHWGSDVPNVIISYDFWLEHLEKDQNAIGKKIRINGRNMAIVAVTSKSFVDIELYNKNTSVWMPWSQIPFNQQELKNWFVTKSEVTTLAKLAENALINEAESASSQLINQHYQQYASTLFGEEDNTQQLGMKENHNSESPIKRNDIASSYYATSLSKVDERIATNSSQMALTLLVSILMVTLIAVVNTLILLLIHNIKRIRQHAIYFALGANNQQIFRQYFIQIWVMLLLSFLIAILVNAWLLKWLHILAGGYFPRLSELVIGLGTISSFLVASVAISYLFARWAFISFHNKQHTNNLMRFNSMGRLGLPKQQFQVILMVQATVVTLMISAAYLVLSSSYRVINQQVNINALSTLSVDVASSSSQTKTQRFEFNNALANELRSIEGIESVILTYEAPMASSMNSMFVDLSDKFIGSYPTNFVTPAFFEFVGLNVIVGSLNLARHQQQDYIPIVVSASAALKMFSTLDVIGNQVKRGAEQLYQIVAVVEDELLPENSSAFDEQGYQVYLPYEAWNSHLLVKAFDESKIENIKIQIEEKLAPIDDVSSIKLASLLDLFRELTQRDKHYAILALVIGGLSIALSCIGAHAVMKYRLVSKKQEIAIRMALGTRHGQLYKMIFKESTPSLFAGILAAILISFLLLFADANNHLTKQLLVTTLFVAPFSFLLFELVALSPLYKFMHQNLTDSLKSN